MNESIYIQNAGLLILSAFLPRYFKMLDMLNSEDQFRDEASAMRAVQLLEYVASGRTEVPEEELIFNKVLCGLDIYVPLETGIELTELEVETSEQLLTAVLQNWDKMSNSSVENLRGSFLLRAGMLTENQEHWSLEVESAGYDILLNYLSWTISVVSLPWMHKRLETNWKHTAG